MGTSRVTVPPEDSGTRLDLFLSRHFPGVTRSRIKKLIEERRVLVDGAAVKAGASLRPGSVVTVTMPDPEPPDARPEDIPLKVLYEDSHLIVIDKPPHMVVHPSHGHASGTLVNALLHHCRDLSGIGGVARPGIVHRLDKGTSGVMVAAKNDAAHRNLAAQFKGHTIGRVYLAAVKGEMRSDSGRIEKPLGRHPRNRKRITVRQSGRGAVTDFEVLARRGGMSLVLIRPGTGRTHQIRVHMASLGHPVLCDATYGGGVRAMLPGDAAAAALLRSLNRPALHAVRLRFDHPVTGRSLDLEAPEPADLSGLFTWIRGGAP